LRRITHGLFGGSAELLLTRLVEDENVTDEELLRMRDLLERRLKGEGS
jgi:hypothetical protein